MSNSALAAMPADNQAIAPVATPMAMIQRALDAALASGEGLTVASLILDQMRQQRDYEDRVAFNAALRRIQDALKPIAKRGVNPETHSRYSTAEDIDAMLDDLLAKERMSLSFEPRVSDKPDEVLIVGILSLGAYSKEYPLPMPADGKGAKGGGVMSRTHATGSAITYGKRYLKNMIFNLRFKEKDDDGNAASGAGTLGDKEHAAHMENIEHAANGADLTRYYLAAIKDAGNLGDRGAIAQFERAANKRKKELQP